VQLIGSLMQRKAWCRGLKQASRAVFSAMVQRRQTARAGAGVFLKDPGTKECPSQPPQKFESLSVNQPSV